MFENVSKELLEKAKLAKTKEEALAILRDGGVELTDEDLRNIAGGEEGDPEGLCWTNCGVDGSKCIAYSVCGFVM